MLWPTVTELPRNLEPAGEDTFIRDLAPRGAPPQVVTKVLLSPRTVPA